MIILLQTASANCEVTIVDANGIHSYTWEANRDMARGIVAFIEQCLAKHNAALQDIGGIGVMKGPGSFTGLRIGASVANTLADSFKVAIVGVTGESWKEEAVRRLERGENDAIILPEYGRPARVTQPRK